MNRRRTASSIECLSGNRRLTSIGVGPASIILIALALLFPSFAQQPPPVPAQPQPALQPQPPTIPRPPQRIQVQPGTPPVILGPGVRLNSATAAEEPEPAASASIDVPVARVGRPFEYRVTITGSDRVVDLAALEPPEGLQFEKLPIPGYGMMTVNGQLVNTSTLRFTVTAERAGEFKVPSFPVRVGAKQVQVPAVRIPVTELAPGEAVYQPVRVVLDLPKRNFYVGETIDARLLFIETPDEIPQYIHHITKASGEVLFKPSQRTRGAQFEFEGKQMRGITMPVQITPIVAGETSVGCQVVLNIARTSRLGGTFSSQATIDTPPAKMQVLALPQAGRPKGFTGGIGKFTIAQPTLSSNETEVGEPIGLTVALRGTGNLDGVPPPELDPASDWSSFRPTSSFERNEDGDGSGTKTFTYTLVPKRDGRRGTPALPFAYFDPEKHEFVDITVPPIPVNVKPAPANAAAPVADTTNKEPSGPTEPPREAEPVLTGLAEQSGVWTSSMGPNLRTFLLWQIAPPVLLLLLWAWRKRQEHLANHPEILRRRRARAATRVALAEARAAARRGDQAGFFQAGLGALREAAAPLDTTQAASLTREEVLRQLDDDERAAKAAKAIFENADAVRYASTTGTLPQPSTLLPELERAVARLGARA